LDRLDVLNAVNENFRIVFRNSHRIFPEPYLPVKKTIPGNGLVLAQAVGHIAVQNGLHAPAHPAAVGSTPPHFNPDLITYSHDSIYQMIIFYNDNFGILPGDTLATRVESFRCFFSLHVILLL